MSPKELTAFRVEADIMEGLRRVKDRDGVPLSVQVDRALRAWLEEKGVTLKKASKTNRRAPNTATRRRRA
jgi:transposase